MAKIFISYRREDSGFAVDQLHGALKPYVDNPSADIFIDVDNIPPGVDFVDHLDKKVAQCEVMLVAIGQRWLDAVDPDTGARRLDDPDDVMRIEITRALARNIPVVPVLIGGAEMPPVEALPGDLKPLARRQATPIGRGRVEEDVADLADGLGLKKTEAPQPKGKGGLVAALLGLVVLGGGAAGVWVLDPFSGGETDSPSGPAPIETAEAGATAEPEEDVTIFEDDTAQGPAADVPAPSEEPDAESAADAASRAGDAAYNAKNYAEARQLFTKACDGGEMSGCNNLGYMYDEALGVTQDYTRARQLYTKACDGGNDTACQTLENLGDRGR